MCTLRKAKEFARHALAIEVWDDEGGAPAPNATDHDFGRRVEADRSWTVYHVFTGVPARVDGLTMGGLSRSDATDKMLLLNRRAVVIRQMQRKRRKRDESFRSLEMPEGIASKPWH